MNTIKISAIAMAALLLAACADSGTKQNVGTVLGGVGGAVAGSAFGSGKGRLVGVAAGTLLGALVGSEVGKSLDRADVAAMHQTNQTALESGRTGQVSEWHNPDTGASGTVTPQRTYQAASGQYCREFQQTVSIGGKTENAYGTACRQPDGSWKVIN